MKPTSDRYRLFCRAHGFDPDETKPSIVKGRVRLFPRWVAQQREAFRDRTGANAFEKPDVFDAWLSNQVGP